MKLPEITKIEINWWIGYGNAPSVNVHLDREFPQSDFTYMLLPDKEGETRKNVWLLSTNNWPWVRFVRIDDADGNPTYCGALGGEYELTYGTKYKTRTGWSSRASAVNKLFVPEYIEEDIDDVTVYDTRFKSGWAGYSICVDYLTEHPLWPESVYMVKQVTDRGERRYTPSLDNDIITKPGA